MILDIMLPGLSGYRVVQTLRAERNWLPVLMLSAKDGEYDQADGLDCGADDYLTKPFSYVVLLARLRALLRRGAPERPSVLQVGELMLAGTSGIVLGLAAGSLALVAIMSYTLQRTVDRDADTTAGSIVAMIEQDGVVSRPLPVPAGQVAQVLDSSGHVTAGSSNADL